MRIKVKALSSIEDLQKEWDRLTKSKRDLEYQTDRVFETHIDREVHRGREPEEQRGATNRLPLD